MLFFVLKCKLKEHVHNLNRRWARSALNAQKEGAKCLEFLVIEKKQKVILIVVVNNKIMKNMLIKLK